MVQNSLIVFYPDSDSQSNNIKMHARWALSYQRMIIQVRNSWCLLYDELLLIFFCFCISSLLFLVSCWQLILLLLQSTTNFIQNSLIFEVSLGRRFWVSWDFGILSATGWFLDNSNIIHLKHTKCFWGHGWVDSLVFPVSLSGLCTSNFCMGIFPTKKHSRPARGY